MEYIPWDESFKTGITVFDRDHRELVRLLNELHSGLVSGFSISEMTFILDDLVRYTGVHFKREEELMDAHSYPDTARHKAEHADLVRQVVDFQDQLKKGKKHFTIQLMAFLKDWLVNHILKTDMQYGTFFRDRGIQ
jgi:hemerythrin-like metal-binding protein